MIATTDPATLPDPTTWYVVTNLPASDAAATKASALAPADVAEVVRLYGLRNWVEQSYKQVKGTLGWNAYQVRKDPAIRRHWALVCCAFSFCWWADRRDPPEDVTEPAMVAAPPPDTTAPVTELPAAAVGEKPADAHALAAGTAAAGLVAGGAAPGAGLVGAVGQAHTVLARLVTAPTAPAPASTT